MPRLQPPNVNGLCAFIDDMMICDAVSAKLAEIRDSFVPDDENEAVSTFWITAKYNSTVAGTPIDAANNYPIINGDTAEHCLSLRDGQV